MSNYTVLRKAITQYLKKNTLSVNTNIYKTPDPPAVARQEECGGAFRTIGALEALKARIILEKVDMPGGKIG